MGIMYSSINSSTTLQSWRERSPSYSLKIQNFSQFEKSTLLSGKKYESSPFSSGGYNWNMIIYPKGNDKDEGSGYISMYVEIDTTSLMSKPRTEVLADLRFFVFNKKENKYFTIQYLESKTFNILRTVSGIPKMIACDTFNDPKNGYIFEGDECEFGVDVIVAPPPTNWEILSNQKLKPTKFYWRVKKFSKLEEHVYTSGSFSMGARNWILKLYPKGDTRAEGKWLSICLQLAETTKDDEKIFAQAKLRLVDPRGSNHITRQLNNWPDQSSPGWSCYQFVSLDKVHKAYLDKEDTLTVEVEFDVVSATKIFSPMI